MSSYSYVCILGNPGADSGDEGKSKRAEKCSAKKSKERREEPLGTMSYQTSFKRSPPFWLLIGARKLVFFFLSLVPNICPWVTEDVGLLNCQIDVDRPPYGIVTSLLVPAMGAFIFKTQWAR